MRSPGARWFALNMAEVTSISLAGFLLRFPCQVQRNSLEMENSSEVDGTALRLSLAEALFVEAVAVI